MASFDFLENFFFVSLAITFGLILLLVYHFKQRISTVERNSDLMNDILSNVVKEMKIIRTSVIQHSSIFSHAAITPDTTALSSMTYAAGTSVLPKDTIVYHLNEISDEEGSENDDNESSYSNEDDEVLDVEELSGSESDDTGSDDGSDIEEDSVSDESVHRQPENPKYNSENDDTESVGSESTTEVFHVNHNHNTVAHTPEPILDNSESSSHNVFDDVIELAHTIPEEDLHYSNLNIEEIDLNAQAMDTGIVQNGMVGGETGMGLPERQMEEVLADETKQTKELYRKMNITQLRTIAISMGLNVDTSKLKKNDLIKLLSEL